MPKLGFTHKNVIVYGLGKNGRAVATALADNRAHVQVYDIVGEGKVGSTPEGFKLLERTSLFFKKPTEEDFETCNAFFKSPGISSEDPIVRKAAGMGVPLMGDMDLLYRREYGATFIGITGTNGKSTTTALVGHILQDAGLDAVTGGNLGEPCLALPKGRDIYVLELSSYQLELMQEAVMDRAAIVNISPDHLERHGTLANYKGVKMNIFARQIADKHQAWCGADSEELLDVKKFAAHAQQFSGHGKEVDVFSDDEGVLHDGGLTVDLKQFKNLPGVHNWQNMAAAYSLTKGLVTLDQFVSAVNSFKNLPHRMEKIAESGGVSFYNDSKATNPESAICALSSFDRVYWIVGGQPKDCGIAPCFDYLDKVKSAFVIGQKTDEMVAELSTELADQATAYPCYNLTDAVWMAWREIHKRGESDAVILLSPACASWDQFDSFEHRGDVFTSTVYDILRQSEQEGKTE